MTNTKLTKRALLSSVLSIVLCVSMLLGTTYAWFTDSVVSGSNLIQTGNLDIEVEYTLDGETWANLDGATDLFQKSLWEPGHTEVVVLRVKNTGTLALKYSANMNITNEVVGKTKDGRDIVLSDILTVTTIAQQANEIGDILVGLIFGGSQNTDPSNTVPFKSANILASNQELLAGEAHYVCITVDMAETVGNEANHDGVNIPSIEFGVNVIATQYTYEEDSFGNQYDAETPILVETPEQAQEVFNNAASGTTIQLMPGVNYGTLTIDAQVGVNEAGKPTANNENTALVDYFTTKYPTGEYTRTFNDITIIGAPGAIIEGIQFVTGTFKVTNPATGKQSGTMYKFVEINNLVIDGVEFSDTSTLGAGTSFTSPLFFDLQSVKVNGLTVKNCTLEGNKDNMNFVYAYGNAAKDCTFGVTLNDVVIENNTVSGIARLCELRECNNLTVSGNTAKNLTKDVALLSNNSGKAYSGTLTFDGNNADTFGGFFARIGVGGDANVVVTNNTIANCGYASTYPEYAQYAYVCVTSHTGELIAKNNILA